MSDWRRRLFVRNESNFWGWLLGGIAVLGLGGICAVGAATYLFRGGALDPLLLAVVGILVTLLGQFALSLQEFYARWVEANPESDGNEDQDEGEGEREGGAGA